MFLTITEFIGHFHPLLVHLPIGILLIALLLQWVSAKEKFQSYYAPVPFLLLCGMISAIAACISGYFLSISDDYNKGIVGWHKWMGISVAVVSVLLYAKERKVRIAHQLKFLSFVLFILIMITGHLGGLLTHGSDYLTGPLADIFSEGKSTNMTIKPVPNVQEAIAYNDVVQPIFQTRCYSCHGPNKQKGKLRLDDSTSIMKGGEDGPVIDLHNADKSEMIKRLLLPVDNEDHMPPKEKPQPSESQVTLLHWWISTGAEFNKRVKDLNQPENLKPILLALQEVPEVEMKLSSVPDAPVEQAPTAIIEKLREKGVIILPVANASNYLSASFVTDSLITTEELDHLIALKKQLIWLKIGFTNLTDEKMAKVKELSGLTKLSIEHTSVTDKGIAELKLNKKLQYLNVVGTNVTAKGLLQLKDLKELHNVYVYRTNINQGEWKELITAMPETRIDTGNYIVPTFATDTVEVKVASKN